MEQKKPTVIDLFAGAGGLSYGFEMAGFDVKLAVEKDAWAAETYAANHTNKNILEADMRSLDNAFFAKYNRKIDVIVNVKPPRDLHLHSQYVTILPYSSR